MGGRQALVPLALLGMLGLGLGAAQVPGVAAARAGAAGLLWTAPVGRNPSAVAVDEQTGRAFVVSQGDLDAYANPVGRGSVAVLDPRSGQRLATLTVGVAPVAVATDPRSGHVFVVNAGEGSVTILDGWRGRVLGVVAVGPGPRAVAVDVPDRRVIVASAGVADSMGTPIGAGSVSLLDAGSGQVVGTVALGAAPLAVAVDQRRGHAVLLAANRGLARGTLSVLDIRSRRILGAAPTGWLPGAVAIDERLGRAFVIGQGNAPGAGLVTMVDTRAGRLVRTVPLPALPLAVAADPRTGHVVVATGAGALDVLDARTGALSRAIALTGYPAAAALTINAAAGRAFLAIPTGDGVRTTVWVLATQTGRPLRTLATRGTLRAMAGSAGISALVVSADPSGAGSATMVTTPR